MTSSERLPLVTRISGLFLAAALLLAMLPPAAVAVPAQKVPAGVRLAEMRTVLAVIEDRVADARVTEKMRKRLPELDGRELRLAALLCERISRDEKGAGANIAFSIVTAMIVLR